MPVYPLPKGWQIRFHKDGVNFKKNYPNLTKKQAELLESQTKVKLAMGELHKPGDDIFIVFAQSELPKWAKDNWARPEAAENFLATFAAFFGQKRFKQISPLLIEQFKSHLRKGETRRGAQRSEKTVNRYLAVLSRCFWLALKQGLIKENPCRQVSRFTEGEGRIRYLSPEEYDRLTYALEFQPDYLQALVKLAMNTAMRWGNLHKLRVEEIHFSSSSIHLNKTKSGHALRVPMNGTVCELLAEWIEKHHLKSGYLFVNPKTGKPYTTIKRSLTTLLKAAEIENFTFHCFRHDAITEMVDQGHSLVTVAEIAGHRRIQTTMKYAHAKEQSKQAAVAGLGRRKENSPPMRPSQNVIEFKKPLTG